MHTYAFFLTIQETLKKLSILEVTGDQLHAVHVLWHNEKQLNILKRVKIPGDKKLNRHFWKRRAKHVFPFICEVILEHPVIQTELCQLGEKKCYQKIRKKSSEKTLLIKGW